MSFDSEVRKRGRTHDDPNFGIGTLSADVAVRCEGRSEIRLAAALFRDAHLAIASRDGRPDRESFGELRGLIAAIDPARAKGEFKFASERDDEITELPNPLPARAIN